MSTKNRRISLSIPTELLEWVESYAASERRSVSAQVSLLIEKFKVQTEGSNG